MPLYSHSKLSTYEICPLQYKLRYLDKIKVEGEESIEAFLGKRVHEALERFYKNLRYTKAMSLDEVIDYYTRHWEKNWNSSVTVTNKDLSPQNYEDTGKKCLRNYYHRYTPFDKSMTVGIEEMVSFSLSGDGKYRIQGFIDRLDRTKDGTYEIHDYKTSGSLPLQEYLDDDRQLALYEIGIRKKFSDVKEVRLIWHYLVFDTEITSVRTSEQLETLKTETISLIDKIESDKEFKHRESNLCNWCDYPEYCPAKRHLIKVGALPPDEYLVDDGVYLVNKYIEIWMKSKETEKELKELKEALIQYARQYGVEFIAGSGYFVKVTQKEKFKFPDNDTTERRLLEEIIKEEGLWQEVSKLDANELSKVIESKKWNDILLEKIKKLAARDEIITVSQPRLFDKKE